MSAMWFLEGGSALVYLRSLTLACSLGGLALLVWAIVTLLG